MKDKLITYPRIYNPQGTECFFKLPEEILTSGGADSGFLPFVFQ